VTDTRCGGNVANRRAFITSTPELRPSHGTDVCDLVVGIDIVRPALDSRVGGGDAADWTQLGVGRAPRGKPSNRDAAQQRCHSVGCRGVPQHI
jgi:hypothetical protein